MTKKMNFYLERSFADNLNSLDRFKVDAKAVRERYGVIKAHFESKEKRVSKKFRSNTPLYGSCRTY